MFAAEIAQYMKGLLICFARWHVELAKASFGNISSKESRFQVSFSVL
jgi:hypothetical protein